MRTLSIRLPDSLHKRIKQMVAAEGISMNQFITLARQPCEVQRARTPESRMAAARQDRVCAVVGDANLCIQARSSITS